MFIQKIETTDLVQLKIHILPFLNSNLMLKNMLLLTFFVSFFASCIERRLDLEPASLTIGGKIDCPQRNLTTLIPSDYIVSLYRDNEVLLRTTRPTADGRYFFDELQPDLNYSVGVKRTTALNTTNSSVTSIENYLLNRPRLSDLALIAGDVDRNGEIDATDLLHVRRFVMGITPALPSPMWRMIPAYWIDNQNNFIPNAVSPLMSLQRSVMNFDLIMVQLGDMGLTSCN